MKTEQNVYSCASSSFRIRMTAGKFKHRWPWAMCIFLITTVCFETEPRAFAALTLSAVQNFWLQKPLISWIDSIFLVCIYIATTFWYFYDNLEKISCFFAVLISYLRNYTYYTCTEYGHFDKWTRGTGALCVYFYLSYFFLYCSWLTSYIISSFVSFQRSVKSWLSAFYHYFFVGRSKGMKGRCTPAESLRSFIDMKPDWSRWKDYSVITCFIGEWCWTVDCKTVFFKGELEV